MFRFITHLLGRPFEECKSCETLKQQLEFERSEKKQLLDTLLNIVKPQVVEAVPQMINPVAATGSLFSRRRAALEAADRLEAQTIRESKVLGRPDGVKMSDISKLEKEVGISDEVAEIG